MNKTSKKILAVCSAAALCVSAFAMGACDYKQESMGGPATTAAVSSQGGWVVEKGGYVYFINGAAIEQTDDAGNTVYDNEFGNAVKGSLCRITKADLDAGNYSAAKVIVPLIVAGKNYDAGIFVYGDYVYYATPSTATNLQGVMESSAIEFKRSKLDGSETMKDYFFRSTTDSVDFRFVEVGGKVYCLHNADGNLYSYSVEDKKDTLLVKGIGEYLFNEVEASDPYVYYTMSVTADVDQEHSTSQSYNQIYRVRADAAYSLKNGTLTATGDGYSYSYQFDVDSLSAIADKNDRDFDKNDVEDYPYVNLGQAVLDGIGTGNVKTMQTVADSVATADSVDGYTYALLDYSGDGIYYTRTNVTALGEGATTYYLANSSISKDAIANNGQTKNDLIGKADTKATADSYFYQDEAGHHYFYTSGDCLVRVDLTQTADGVEESEVKLTKGVAPVSYLQRDAKYLYFTVTSNETLNVYRVDYTQESDFNSMLSGKEQTAVDLFAVGSAAEWYAPELIDGYLFYLDGLTVGDAAYAYPRVVKYGDMTNEQIMDLNEEIAEASNLFTSITEKVSSNASNVIYYYYITGGMTSTKYSFAEPGDATAAQLKAVDEANNNDGKIDLYEEVIIDALVENRMDTAVFSAKEKDCIKAYLTKGTYEGIDFSSLDHNGLYSYDGFYHLIGLADEAEADTLTAAWKVSYLSGVAETETEEGLPTWAWWLIGIGIAVGVAGIACAITIPLVLRARKNKGGETQKKRKKVVVEMDVDESIDVYADEPTEAEETVEEAVEETVEEPVVESVEETTEEVEAAEEAVEESAEEAQEPAVEEPTAE